MRRVDREQDLESALRDASSEALRAFRNDEVYSKSWCSSRATSKSRSWATITAT